MELIHLNQDPQTEKLGNLKQLQSLSTRIDLSRFETVSNVVKISWRLYHRRLIWESPSNVIPAKIYNRTTMKTMVCNPFAMNVFQMRQNFMISNRQQREKSSVMISQLNCPPWQSWNSSSYNNTHPILQVFIWSTVFLPLQVSMWPFLSKWQKYAMCYHIILMK